MSDEKDELVKTGILYIVRLEKKGHPARRIVDDNIQDLVFRVSDLLKEDDELKAGDYIAELDLKTMLFKYHVYDEFII